VEAPDGEQTADGIRLIKRDFALELPGGEVRHSPDVLAAAIMTLVEQHRLGSQESVSGETSVGTGRFARPPIVPPILAGPQNL
jgi:hypothetical protein